MQEYVSTVGNQHAQAVLALLGWMFETHICYKPKKLVKGGSREKYSISCPLSSTTNSGMDLQREHLQVSELVLLVESTLFQTTVCCDET